MNDIDDNDLQGLPFWKIPSTERNRKSRKPEISQTPKKQHIKKTRKKTPGPHPTNDYDGAESLAVTLRVKSPLEIFFSRYSEFQYRPASSSITEFNRLCKEYNWQKYDAEKTAARHKFNLAVKNEFSFIYGSDEYDPNSWYKLCRVMRIDPVPSNLNECRAAVFKWHVNLVDLVDSKGSREDVPIFESEKELGEYTRENRKFFPKPDAADGAVLRALRRHILVPQDGP